MSELDNILNDSAEAPAAPVAGRTRTAVASGGSSILPQVGDSFEAVFNGTSDVAGKFGTSKLYRFTLIAPAELTVVHKDKDSGVKSEERKTIESGASISMFGKGNFSFLLGNVAEGQDIEVRRVEDGVLPKSHAFAGTKVQTYEVLA